MAEAGDRTARHSKLESLLGDTVVRLPTVDDSDAEPSPSTHEPALAEFLGVDPELDPVDVSGIAAVAPLVAGIELGPLADLGPELAKAMATITACLEDTLSESWRANVRATTRVAGQSARPACTVDDTRETVTPMASPPISFSCDRSSTRSTLMTASAMPPGLLPPRSSTMLFDPASPDDRWLLPGS